MKQVIIDYKKGMNMSKIARKYKCSVTPIRRILKINDIRIRQTGEVNTLDLPTDQIFTYYQNGMSISKIARKYKCSKNAIVKRLKDNNVYRYREDIDIPLNEMILEYQNGMNSIQLGTKYNCNQQTIINKLKKVGITIRTKKELIQNFEKVGWANRAYSELISGANTIGILDLNGKRL